MATDWKVDPFSSGVDFPGWKELEDSAYRYRPRESYKGFIVWCAKTWLLREGWKRGGPAISVFDVPGPLPEAIH